MILQVVTPTEIELMFCLNAIQGYHEGNQPMRITWARMKMMLKRCFRVIEGEAKESQTEKPVF
jgi:hypothetical protein